MGHPRTLYEKLWDSHVVERREDGTCLVYIDRHLIHEVTSPQAFEGLRAAGRRVRRPELTLAVADHNLPTTARVDGQGVRLPILDPASAAQLAKLELNVAQFGILYFEATAREQGIVHVVGPEQGFTLPGTTVVCGDSHTAAHGALGALAFGIGTSEVEHVLASQTLVLKQSKTMEIRVDGALGFCVSPKDVILAIIGRIGTAGATGHVIEYRGSTFDAMSIEGRLTVANMSIEAGARSGLFAPDDKTFDYLKGRPMAPTGAAWDQAVDRWRDLATDQGAQFDRSITIDASDIAPSVTWGTSPEDVAPITATVPNPDSFQDPARREVVRRSLDYMGLTPGQRLQDVAVEHIFIGSCTNSRIEDLRDAALVLAGRRRSDHIKQALVVPGSGLVKRQAEAEGLDRIFVEAGFEWREPGCSMCLAMNPDKVPPRERCASTSNRNFKGRQGPECAHAPAVTGNGGGGSGDRPPHRRSGADAMTPFTRVEGRAYPLGLANVDTDLIIPAAHLKTISRHGLGAHAFETLRQQAGNVLNDPAYHGASILIAGDNFGCGSSREHAAWALADFGVRAILAPSFSDIFLGNAFKNGIAAVELGRAAIERLLIAARDHVICVDLQAMIVTTSADDRFRFEMDSFRRECLLGGLDEIALTLAREPAIRAYEQARKV